MRRMYSRSTIKMKIFLFSFCIVLTYLYLWLAPKVLPLGNEKPKNFVFCFAIRSFIRTSGLRRKYSRSTIKMKIFLFSFCIVLTYLYLCSRYLKK